MLNDEIIQDNKKRFIELLHEISRPDVDIEGLIASLEKGDFFTAPVTTNSFRNYRGGLCEHSLCRYQELCKIVGACSVPPVEKDSILIAGLLADLGKMNYFEPSVMNRKVYSPTGKKQDEVGNFDWIAEMGWKIKDPRERFIFGSLGQNAERYITEYLPLTQEESAAIIHLHDDYENPNFNLASLYLTYPLAVLLNCADKIAAFLTTREDVLPF